MQNEYPTLGREGSCLHAMLARCVINVHCDAPHGVEQGTVVGNTQSWILYKALRILFEESGLLKKKPDSIKHLI